MVDFLLTGEDARLVKKIAKRAQIYYRRLEIYRDLTDIHMDVSATHLNGCPLDLKKLYEFDDFNFMHDISGIARHLNRDTGKLENFFSPRSSK